MLKFSGLGLGAVLFAGCRIPEQEFQVESPALLPEDLVDGMDLHYATLARSGGRTESVLVRVMEGRAKKVEGNPDYPMSRGKHSAQAEAVLQEVYHPDRVDGPLARTGVRGEGRWEPISWDNAIDQIVDNLRKSESDPAKVALITDPIRGHLGYVVEQFSKGYGARHLSFDSLDDSGLKEVIKRVFGQDQMPAFDIKNSKYILSFGADFLGSWLAPVNYSWQYGEFRQGGHYRGTLVQVEPRLSLTAANADEWVPVTPGTEGMLALSLISIIINEGLADPVDIRQVESLVSRDFMSAFSPDRVENSIGIPADKIRRIAREFASDQPALALAGGLAGAQTNGVFNMTSVYLLNVLVGNIGKPGGVIFNPSPALSTVKGFCDTNPYSDTQKLAEDMKHGAINIALIRGANPVYGTPGSLQFGDALNEIPFVVSFSSFLDETAQYADLVLPDRTSIESWGDDVPDPGPGYQTIALQQPVVVPFADSLAFGDVLLTIVDELGIRQKTGLPWQDMRSALKDGADRLFELKRGEINAGSSEEFWLGILQRGGWWDTKALADGGFTVTPQASLSPSEPTFSGDVNRYPFHLLPFHSNSVGDGVGSHLPWLQSMPDPLVTAVWSTWIELNTDRANELGIREGDIILVESPHGSIEALAYLHPATPPDRVSVPFGQGHSAYGRYAEGLGTNVMDLLDPNSKSENGALAWGSAKVSISKTGRRSRVPKFEGTVDAVQLAGHPVVEVTKPE